MAREDRLPIKPSRRIITRVLPPSPRSEIPHCVLRWQKGFGISRLIAKCTETAGPHLPKKWAISFKNIRTYRLWTRNNLVSIRDQFCRVHDTSWVNSGFNGAHNVNCRLAMFSHHIVATIPFATRSSLVICTHSARREFGTPTSVTIWYAPGRVEVIT